MTLVLHHALPADAAAPGHARTLIDELLLPDTVRRDAALLVSELVTNAIRHARAPQDVPVRVTVTLTDGNLRTEVRDGGAATLALRPLDPDPYRPGGMGLMLVQQLASRWGQEQRDGTCVWFELDFGAAQPVAASGRPVRPLAERRQVPHVAEYEPSDDSLLIFT